jgi:hypothetical protein
MQCEELRTVPLKLTVPLQESESLSFRAYLEKLGAKAGPFVRRMILTVIDPSTGPIVEAAMRGRPVPDLSAGQARETSAAIAAMEEQEDLGDVPAVELHKNQVISQEVSV